MASSRAAYLFVNPEEQQPSVSLMVGNDKRQGIRSPLRASARTVSGTPSTGGAVRAELPDMFLGTYPVLRADSDGATECQFRPR